MTLKSLLFTATVSGLCATTSMAAAQAVDLRGDTLALALQTTATAAEPRAPVIGSQAALSVTPLDDLTTQLRVGAEAGAKAQDLGAAQPWIAAPAAGRWNSGKLGLDARWSPSPLFKIDIGADDNIRRDVDHVVANWTSATDQRVFTRAADARVAATLSPAAPLSLQVGGETSDHLVQTATSFTAGQAATSDLLRTRSERVVTTLQWKPLPLVALEGGGKVETIGVSWAGAGERADDYAYLEPKMSAAVTPWSGTTWKLGVERVVSPIRAEQFALFAQAAAGGAGPSFAPDQEWRYQASLHQQLSDTASFSASYTRARLENVTDLGPVGAAQAPVAIGAGRRDQIEASLTTPLPLFEGLPLNVRASAVWRNSQVDDPFTRTQRRLSGETPYDAQLTLSPQAPDAAFRWGVKAMAAGAATTYQMSQTTTQSATAGIGGFVEYRPGPIAIQLNLDNIVGGGRSERDVYYTGSREINLIDRIAESRNASRMLRISLIKPL